MVIFTSNCSGLSFLVSDWTVTVSMNPFDVLETNLKSDVLLIAVWIVLAMASLTPFDMDLSKMLLTSHFAETPVLSAIMGSFLAKVAAAPKLVKRQVLTPAVISPIQRR